MPVKTVIKHRSDTAANWTSVNPVLALGEVGYVSSGTNAGFFKIGDGSTAWNSLAFQNVTGPTGAAATITVGSTTTGAAGSSATVTNSGTSSAAVFNFTIPQGLKGDKGDTGPAASTVTTINAQVGTSYTVALVDKDALVTLTNSAAISLQIPTNAAVAFPIGTNINIAQFGTGQVTVSAVTPGTTSVFSSPGYKLRGQYSAASLIKVDTDKWLLSGDTVL